MHSQTASPRSFESIKKDVLLFSSDLLRLRLVSDSNGVVEVPALDRPRIAIYIGRPVRLECRHGDESHAGTAIHGDIDIIPPGLPARWEMKERDTALVITLASSLMKQVAEESGCDPGGLELRSRFQIRDPQIEHISWALMAEARQGFPSGPIYMDSMATALAAQLLQNHSSLKTERVPSNGGPSARKLRLVLAYVEENMSEPLSLGSIAAIAGLSVSHLKVLFRKSMGIPVHQYVIRRRVERAAALLQATDLPICQVALEVGFCHQSHLAMHMRRILGVVPHEFSKIVDSALLTKDT